MSNKAIQRKGRINKFLSVLLIYALFFQEFVPFARSMNTIEFNRTNTSVFYHSNSEEPDLELTDFKGDADVASKEADIDIQQLTVATTSGPGQSESSGFSIGTTDGMVDKFTGDFTYAIPLMNVEGYPITLSYNSNVTMLQEASWVGLGWDLNVGSVSREMQGIPDEFNGDDEIVRTFKQLDNSTTGNKKGGYFGIGKKFNGVFTPSTQLTLLFGKYNDNYLGLGKTIDLGLQGQFSIANGDEGNLFLAPTFNLGFNYDSKNGVGRSQSIGVSGGYGRGSGLKAAGNISFGNSYNSRVGTQQKSIGFGLTAGVGKNSMSRRDFGYGTSSSISYGTATSIPRVQMNSEGTSDNFQLDLYGSVQTTGGMNMRLGFITQNYSSNSVVLLDANQQLIQPAFGYMHSGKRVASEKENAVMDFNRGMDSEFSEEMKNLAFSFQTHDIFYVNASGIGGTFRPMRKDYGTYYDPTTKSLFNKDSKLFINDDQSNLSTGVEYDLSKPATIGFGIGYSSGTMKGDINSGLWDENGGMEVLKFDAESPGNAYDESVYFRSVGEHTPVDMNAWNAMNGNQEDFYKIVENSGSLELTSTLGESNTSVTSSSLNSNNTPTSAATYFDAVTVEESLTESSSFPNYSTAGVYSFSTINRQDPNLRKLNHISQIKVVSPDGGRYTYGIPMYNISSAEVSFASEGLPSVINGGLDQGLVTYTADVDNSVNNSRGRSYYFDKTEVPSYAHSFLLTEMTSSDYVDRTGDGPSLDDVGNYYKFNHTQFYGGTDPFKWRFPMGDISGWPIATQARGVLGSELDDMAHYSYGEKEIWYTHSIESKNLVAEFYLVDREDAHAVLDENGFLDATRPLQKLDRIVLYNRSERLNNSNAKPLQTIQFYYDYSLCHKAPGNINTYGTGESGKLTLKGIRVFSGDSKEQALSGYTFEYGNTTPGSSDNPEFSYNDVDAWGMYKKTSTNKPNDVFPYVIQNETLANNNVQAWKLKAINNPIGGRVEVTYEADRYGYVQNKRAMRHFDIHGMLNIFELLKLQDQSNWNGNEVTNDFHTDYNTVQNMLTSIGVPITIESIVKGKMFEGQVAPYMNKFGKFDIDAVPNNVIVFKLEDPISISGTSVNQASDMVKDKYFLEPSAGPNNYLKELYFKMHVNIKQGVDELVPMTVDISDNISDALDNVFPWASDDLTAIGVMPETAGTGLYEYGYVVIDPVNTGNKEKKGGDKVENGSLVIHPLQLASLQFARQNLIDVVYGSCTTCNDPDLSIDWRAFFGMDAYKYMIQDGGYCHSFIDDYSTIRLIEPDNIKFGGNARVSKIKYIDNWDLQSGEYPSSYSWEYDYTIPTENGSIESGVASFEGRSAIDENALYEWDSYVNIKKNFPDERKFTPTPVTEKLYPREVVGYRHVEVKFNGVNDYGHSISNYHTCKDERYKTKSRSIGNGSSVDATARIRKKNILTGKSVELNGLTQGYTVETNDFHGKPDVFKVVDRNDNIISRTTYHYRELGEQVPMVNRTGQVTSRTIATEYDIHADSRYVSDVTKFLQAGLNFVLYYTPPALFSFSLSPSFSMNSRERGFYSHTLVKHINRSAVVEAIETEYLGSVNYAKNILYDQYSGQVLLSTLVDEFNDSLYSMSYPSHWKYMEFRELNLASSVYENVTLDAYGVFVPNSGNGERLTPGDQIQIDGQVVIVSQNYPIPANGELFLMNTDGTPFTPATVGSNQVYIIESNRNNRLSESMQNVVSKTSVYDYGSSISAPTEVLSSSAITYRDKLNVKCGLPCSGPIHPDDNTPTPNNNEIEPNAHYNPYEYGVRGDLVVDGQYAWQSELNDRTDGISAANDNGIRFDGTYSAFVPFYELNSGQTEWKSIQEQGHPQNLSSDPLQEWRKLGTVTTFDQFGKALESVDQIGVSSSVLYGYSNNYTLVPIAQAVNARQQEIAFDGFEDYSYYPHIKEEACQVTETHFDFLKAVKNGQGSITQEERHSGLFSLMLASGQTSGVTKDISDVCFATEVSDVTNAGISLNDDCACIKPFEPTSGEYIIGAWVKQAKNKVGARIKVTMLVNTSSSSNYQTVYFQPTGEIIDGWQRLEGTFEIPATGGINISIELENNNSEVAYFDDIRIHPFLAGMATTVYDPKTLLPMATHDGYNFTTFFNYDENLNQVRTRVETIEGIKTIVESEAGGQKDY